MLAPSMPRRERAANTTPSPPITASIAIAQVALDSCKRPGLRVGVAVSDSAGNLIVGISTDGALPGRIFMAARKNVAAVVFGQPSSWVQDRLRIGDQAVWSKLTSNMVVYAGAIPLKVGDKTIGAIAVSGGSQSEDEECARAGESAFANMR